MTFAFEKPWINLNTFKKKLFIDVLLENIQNSVLSDKHCQFLITLEVIIYSIGPA